MTFIKGLAVLSLVIAVVLIRKADDRVDPPHDWPAMEACLAGKDNTSRAHQDACERQFLTEDAERCRANFDNISALWRDVCIQSEMLHRAGSHTPYPGQTTGLFYKTCRILPSYNGCWFFRPGTGYNGCWVRERVQCNPDPTTHGYLLLGLTSAWLIYGLFQWLRNKAIFS
jgi:hypothetical protein